MKTHFIPPPQKLLNGAKFLAFAFVLNLIGIGCENEGINGEKQQLSEKEIQRQILLDEDFLSMMTNIYLTNLEGNISSLSKDKQNQYLKAFDSYFNALSKKYSNFHDNTLAALNNKASSEYMAFIKVLNENILSELDGEIRSEKNGKTAAFDAPSVCGEPCSFPTNALSCLTGCLYSETYCLNNGGGSSFCSGMSENCKDRCCSSFCS